MAYNKGMAKIQPAQKTIRFALSGGPAYQYIDLSQVASVVNRRFYRQGINWAVGGFTVIKGTGTGFIGVNRLPETWVLSNSWEKTFRAWKRQQDETLEDGTQESVRARFNDYKVFMDKGHHAVGASANLLPIGSAGFTYGTGEWEYSQIVIPNYGAPGNNYEPYIHMLGSDTGGVTGSIGAIKAYANSRSVPTSPDPTIPSGVLNTDNHLRAMFDVGDNNEDILENVVGKNDNLPYDQLEYPGEKGDETEFVAQINLSNTQSQTQVAGASFPCGLIQLATAALDGTCQFIVHLVPGTHRGYLCEPMTEM